MKRWYTGQVCFYYAPDNKDLTPLLHLCLPQPYGFNLQQAFMP